MADVTNGGGTPREPPNRRMRALQQILEMLQAASNAAGQVTGVGIRAAMPMLEFYAAMRADSVEGGKGPGLFGLTLGEERVLRAAGGRALLELIEITSVTHPIFKDAPAYVSVVDGKPQRPHLMHLLALAAAARAFFGDKPAQGGEPPPPSFTLAPGQTVVFLATAPGEFAVHSGPLPPVEIRRSAMRQRSFAQPQSAMLVEGSDPVMIAPAAMRFSASTRSGSAAMAAGSASAGMRIQPSGGYSASTAYGSGGCGCGKGKGCGCGGHGCSCGGGSACTCGGHHRRFQPARLNADGSCASITSISCDTRWRLRECFKVAFCDLLRCMGDQLCEDGQFTEQPDFGVCVETFFCSLIGCLPDAICPPPEPECCEPYKPKDCLCNFAVGE